jgi:plastocyanin
MKRVICLISLILVTILLVACSEKTTTINRRSVINGSAIEGNQSGVVIDIISDEFSIDPVSIAKGTAVVWVNSDPYTHEMQSSEFGNIAIKSGQQWSYTFDTKGIYPYIDTRNKNRQMRIIVN